MHYNIGLNCLLWFYFRVTKHPFSISPQNVSITGILYFLGTHIALQTMSLNSIILHVEDDKTLLNMNIPKAMPREFSWNSYMLLWRDIMEFIDIHKHDLDTEYYDTW